MSDKKISQLPASTTPLGGTEELALVQSGSTKKVSVNNLTAGKNVSVGALGIGTNAVSYAAIEWAPTGAVTYGAELTPLMNVDTTNVQIVRARPRSTSGTHTDITMFYAGLDGLASGSNTTSGYGVRITKPSGAFTNLFGVHSTLDAVSGGYFLYGAGTADSYLGGNLGFASGKGIDFSADGSAAGMTSELLDDYEEGTWTPVLVNGTSIAYTSQEGYYTKIGNLVHIEAYINVSNNDTGDASNVAIGGLPYAPAGIATVACPVFGINIYDQTLLDIATHGAPLLNFMSPSGLTIALNYTYSQCNASGKLRLSASYRV